MLVIYDKNTKEIISLNGAIPQGKKLSEAEKHPILAESLPDGLDFFYIEDETLIDNIWFAYYQGSTMDIVFEGDVPVSIDTHGVEGIYVPKTFTPAPEPTAEERIAQLETQNAEMLLALVQAGLL